MSSSPDDDSNGSRDDSNDSHGGSDGSRGGDSEEPHGNPRNVVLVVLDTARASDVGERTTPTLARLAEEGTAFDRAFATAPWTLPSHASLFTGTYPTEHGAHGGHPYLDDRFRTVAESFRDAGYDTVGVSNNTWITEEFGFDRGFDELRRGWQYLQSDTDMGAVVRGECFQEKFAAARERLFDGNPIVNAANVLYSEVIQPAGDDGADRTTEWVGEWLADRADRGGDDRPFFLFCNYIEPHVTYDPPRAYAERFLPPDASYEEATAIRQDPRAYDCEDYELSDREFDLLRGLYRGELAYVDEQLGRLRRTLEDAGEWEDTIVVVCGDHGEHVGEHGFFGHQYNLYDTLVHVPLVIRGGPFTGGGHRSDLVQLLDLPDTLLDAAGIEDRALREQSRGRSLYPGAVVGDDSVAAGESAPGGKSVTGGKPATVGKPATGTASAPSTGSTTGAGTESTAGTGSDVGAGTAGDDGDGAVPGADSGPRDAVFAEYAAPQPSIDRLEDRFGELPDRVYEYDRTLRAIRTDEYKYVAGDDGFERLHYLPTDPHEETDISDEEPELAAELADRLERGFVDVEPAEATGKVSMTEGTKDRLADLGYL